MVIDTELIFVYNVNSNPISQAIDFFQLIKSPQTFKCNLYKITHDSFLMKKEWEKSVKSFPIQVRYLYKDEFHKKYPDNKINTPIILIDQYGKITTFISTEEINGILSIKDLIEIIGNKLN